MEAPPLRETSARTAPRRRGIAPGAWFFCEASSKGTTQREPLERIRARPIEQQ
jgi:hypothetical protein